MRCILSLSLFSLVSIARCLTLAPDVLTNQISSSNNPGSLSHEYDFPDQGLSEIADASNDGCTPDGAATGKASERRNLMLRSKVCRPSDQEKKPTGVPFNQPPRRPPSKIHPDFPGHLDNLPESYPLLHPKPNEMNLDGEFCPPSMTGDRIYAYCETGLSLDRIPHDMLEPRSWDLLRCEDCTSPVNDILSLSPPTNFFLLLLLSHFLRTTNLAFGTTVNPITGCFFSSGGFQASVWCCHEQTTANHKFFGQVCLKIFILGPFERA